MSQVLLDNGSKLIVQETKDDVTTSIADTSTLFMTLTLPCGTTIDVRKTRVAALMS